MAIKIKIFNQANPNLLEEYVNQFISKIGRRHIIDIKYSDNTQYFSVLIIYEEEEERRKYYENIPKL